MIVDPAELVTPMKVVCVELQIGTSEKAHDFIELIIREMLLRFPIARDEAVGRINQAWGHLDYVGDTDLTFHETAQYWAKTIYYGKDSRWWLGEDRLKPAPYEPPRG
jgi:hypothetical protein